MQAGVRPGCPLAPLLYRVVAQALLCWLLYRGVGIRLHPTNDELTTAMQYADATEVLLGSSAELGTFLECMDIYARGSGQQLNLEKVELLPIGPAEKGEPPGEGAETRAGLRVVTTATALGLPYTDVDRSPDMDWGAQTDKVRVRLARIAQLSLSIFGRAAAAAAYGMHRLTWHMEHGGLPPEVMIDRLESWTARLVDRAQGPDAADRRATGVPRNLLPGHPTTGGFGALTLREHIRARWASAAVRYVVRPGHQRAAPWQQVVDAILMDASAVWRPHMVLTAMGDSPWRGLQKLEPEVKRVVTALAALPRVVDIDEYPLPPPVCGAGMRRCGAIPCSQRRYPRASALG